MAVAISSTVTAARAEYRHIRWRMPHAYRNAKDVVKRN
jgi:hypothetical protein